MGDVGRPKSANPKAIKVSVRLTDDEVNRLEYCIQHTGLSKAEVLRKGLDQVYKTLKDNIKE